MQKMFTGGSSATRGRSKVAPRIGVIGCTLAPVASCGSTVGKMSRCLRTARVPALAYHGAYSWSPVAS